jgi:hypothetical protein
MDDLRVWYQNYEKTNPYQMSVASFVDCVGFALETCEKTRLNGVDKLELLLAILQEGVTRSNMSIQDKQLCGLMLETGVVENTVGLVISASQNKIKINRHSGWRCCFQKKI